MQPSTPERTAPVSHYSAGAQFLRCHLSGEVHDRPQSTGASPSSSLLPGITLGVSSPVSSGGTPIVSKSPRTARGTLGVHLPPSTTSCPPTPTSAKARKRHPEYTGPPCGPSGQSGGGSRSGRRRLRKRGRPRVSTVADLSGLPDLAGKLADEEYRQQQLKARQERDRRRARELHDHGRGRESQRRRSTGQSTTTSSSQDGAVAPRRMSAPAGRRSLSRRKACGKLLCGWRTSTPGMLCEVCPGGVAHQENDMLCSACHRTLDGQSVTHLGGHRLPRAVQLVEERRSRGLALPDALVDQFRPSCDCLCQRPDCFEAFFRSSNRNSFGRKCAVCARTGSGVKWYHRNGATPTGAHGGDSSGAELREPVWTCQACYSAARRGRATSACVPSPEEGDDVHQLQLSALEKVRARVRETVEGGKIVYWEDAFHWLRDERRRGGERELTSDYGRKMVMKIFADLAEDPGRQSRIVTSKGGSDVGGDGRHVKFALFPSELDDEMVFGFFLQARASTKSAGVADSHEAGDDRTVLGKELHAVLENKGDEVARMAVVRAAGGIVREDIWRQPELQNVPRRGAKHNYTAEMERPVAPLIHTLRLLPRSLVGLLQSVTHLRMRPEMTGEDTGREEEGWIWDAEERVGVEGVRAGPLGNVSEGCPVIVGRHHERGRSSAGSGPGATTSKPSSETAANAISKADRLRRSHLRRLSMLATSVVKAALGGRFMASHDIKATQWAKSKGTTRAVIDLMAEHGLCATTSQLQHREDFCVKRTTDEDLLDKDVTAAAFPFDNCDMEPAVNVMPGEGPHLSNTACTSVAVRAEVGSLADATVLRRRRDLKVDDVMKGPDSEGGEQCFQLFQTVVRRASFDAAMARSSDAGPASCVEVELRKAIDPEKRADAVGRYLFIWPKSTKRFRHNRDTVDRILRIWRGTNAGKTGRPCVIAGDEETYRFLYHLTTKWPDEYSQVRRYPGDWHLLLHMTKALLKRYWGAGIEFVASSLGTDGKKSGDGSNYRRAHHHLTIMYEAVWQTCQEAYFAENPPPGDMPAEDGRHVDGTVEWIKERARDHKSFALWAQFILDDYPAYMTFRTALRTGNFMLRLEALRRIAPIFFITGKDRYQFLVVDHLAEMARMPASDLKVLGELFSVSLGPDVFARMGLDERQEVANRLLKTLTKKIVESLMAKMAPLAQLREIAQSEFEREFIEQPRSARDRQRELVLKRVPAIKTATEVLRHSPAFEGDGGKDMMMSLDGRVWAPAHWEDILNAREKARSKMDDVVGFLVLGDKKKGKTTKKSIFAIPPANVDTKSTKRKGRESSLKDNLANAYAGGQEFKACMLKIFDAVQQGGGVSEEMVSDMVAKIGTTTPYSMANSSGGAKHANKAAGPHKWLLSNVADGFGDDPFYPADAHAVDLPVSFHQGVSQDALEGGTNEVIRYFLREVYERWRSDGERLLVVSYDFAGEVPCIKGLEQGARTDKIGKCEIAFEPLCTEPIPSSQYQAWLRANGKAARDGLATYLCFCGLTEEMWDKHVTDDRADSVVAFYGMEGNPACVADEFGRLRRPHGEGEGQSTETSGHGDLLHFRHGAGTESGVQHQRGPDIGEAELSVVHFIVWSEKYWGKSFDKWLVSSVDTDQWMIILLAMSTGNIRPRGDGMVRVTVKRVVGGHAKFLYVNRVHDKICSLRDGSEPAWPIGDFDGWVPCDEDKVRLFVACYLLAGCDFLPAISGLPFEKMWDAALKSVRAAGLFEKSLFVKQDGVWVIDEMEGVKLLATMFYFKNEVAFRDQWSSPADLLRSVHGDVKEYVRVIRSVIFSKVDKKCTSSCPSFESMLLQVRRVRSVMGYWQDGFKETMPSREYDGKGWGFDPKRPRAEGERLTAENCVLWLSDHSYIGPDRKTVTLTCGCSPDKAKNHRCRGCSCKGRACSLLCGCRGGCDEPLSGARSAPTEGVGCSGKESNGDEDTYVPDVPGGGGESEDEDELDVEAGSTAGIPEWDKDEVGSEGSDEDFWDIDVLGGDGDESDDVL